jgi:hypothetical protein
MQQAAAFELAGDTRTPAKRLVLLRRRRIQPRGRCEESVKAMAHFVANRCHSPTGRKNWLFTGSANGGKTMAVLFSVVSSCQRHGHDPFVYLRDVLERLPTLPRERLAELLPDRWSPPNGADATSATGPSQMDPLAG